MVQCMALRFNFSGEAKHAVLEFTRILAGPKFESLNMTKYFMSKLFNPPEKHCTYVFYCPQCSILLREPMKKSEIDENKCVQCQECNKRYNLSPSVANYFLSVDIEYQLRTILMNESIQRELRYNAKRAQNKILHDECDNIISDVHDGQRYLTCQYIQDKRGKNDFVLTLNMNTDGAPIFQSSKKSMWPIQCIINELPPKLRFKTLILAAIWLPNGEPKPNDMNLYISVFLQQIKKLMEKGIKIVNNFAETYNVFLMLLSLPVDSVARPVLQNRMQYNGYYGCSWCYIPGTYGNRCMKYVMTAEENNPADRCHEEYLKDIEHCSCLGKPIRGVKGKSVLITLPYFDCVWGFPAEYMHSSLLGVTKQLWEKWATDSESQIRLKPTDKRFIDERLIAIRPPSEIHRLPKVLKDRAKWKATEWRSWLLFYSIPCLNGVLPEKAFISFVLFVKSIHALLSHDITNEKLLQVEINLVQFVCECQCLYGECFMTFNVHVLLHLVESVRKNGPLWATSAFPFESGIGHLKNRITGPNGVMQQIVNRTLQINQVKNNFIGVEEKNTWSYCKNLFQYRRISSNYERSVEGAILISNSVEQNSIYNKYNRIIYKETVFHSTSYSRPKKTDNTVVQLENSEIVRISHFVLIDNKCYMICKMLETCKFSENISLDHIFKVTSISRRSEQRSITKIKTKLVCVNVDTNDNETLFYVCIPPNTFEVQ